MTGEVSVRGGRYSIEADVDEVEKLSAQLADVGRSIGPGMLLGLRAILYVDGVAAAALDPVGAMEVSLQAVTAEALAVAAAAGCEALAASVAVAARSYRFGDDLEARIAPDLAALWGLPSAGLTLGAGAAGAAIHGDPHRFGQAASRAIVRDPQLAGVAVEALSGLSPTLAAMLAGELYDDGKPQVSRNPDAPTVDGTGAPHTLTDLIGGLAFLNARGRGGEVDVRRVVTTRADGTVSSAIIVDIPGTRDWHAGPSPTKPRPNVADVGTNLRAFGNGTTSYEQGVVEALRASGVKRNEPVMVVSHSQGGLIGAQLARHMAQTGEFHITHLVTAGAPLGLTDLPPSMRTLSLENRGDVVPQLEGSDNRRRPNQMTVTVNRGGDGLLSRHALDEGYLPGARDVDASGDPSIRDWLHSADAFLGGDSVSTDVYRVTRRP